MANLVTEISKAQENKIPKYLNKWLDIGRRTETTNVEKAKKAVKFFYKLAEKTMPTDIRFVQSPMQANLLIHELNGKTKNDPVEYVTPTSSVHWMGYYGFYDYILNVIFPEKKGDFKDFTSFIKHAQEIFVIYMFEEVAIVCDFPESYSLNAEGQLHGDGKPSMLFRDGYSLFNLNGITVSEEVAMVDEKDITKDMILREENADVRRELIRKIKDPNRLVAILDAETVDVKEFTINGKKTKYELLQIDIDGEGRVRPFLKMTNPSLKDVVHVEGVDQSCQTVEDAIKFRNQLTEFALPQALS